MGSTGKSNDPSRPGYHSYHSFYYKLHVVPKKYPTCGATSWGEPCGETATHWRKVRRLGRGSGRMPYMGLCDWHEKVAVTNGHPNRYSEWHWENHKPACPPRYRDSDGLFEDEDPATAVIFADVPCDICGERLAFHQVGECSMSDEIRGAFI